MAKDRNKVKWEPTLKIVPPDGIKSSDYTHAKPFIPSYEINEPQPKMTDLLSMEYAKVWKKEKEEVVKPFVKDAKYLPKKYGIYGLNKNKQDNKSIKTKKEQNNRKPIFK